MGTDSVVLGIDPTGTFYEYAHTYLLSSFKGFLTSVWQNLHFCKIQKKIYLPHLTTRQQVFPSWIDLLIND